MIVKILGGIDLLASMVLLALIFDIQPPTTFILLPAILVLVKGLFIFTGDVLSAVDIYAAIILLISIPFSVFSIFLWSAAFLMLAKGIVSFVPN